jgi:O-antigen ligase
MAAAAVVVVALLIQPLGLPSVREAQFRSVSLFLADEKNGDESASMRARRWQAAVNCVRKNPALGVGPGQFQARIGEYYRHPYQKLAGAGDDTAGYDVRFDEPGSQGLYEVTAVEMGLMGLLAALWFFGTVIGRAAGGALKDPTGLAAGALGAAVAAAVGGLFGAIMIRGVAVTLVFVFAMGERSKEFPSSV